MREDYHFLVKGFRQSHRRYDVIEIRRKSHENCGRV